MFKSLRVLLLAAAAIGASAIPALATPTDITTSGSIALASGATFIVGDLTFTINSCSSSKDPTACTTDAKITASGATGFTISPTSSTAASFATGAAGSSTFNATDVTINFTVVTNDGEFLGGVNESLTGFGSLTHASETLQTPAATPANSTTNFADSTAVSTATASKYISAPTTSQQISLDIAVGGNTTTGGANSFSTTFAVPEPASLAIVGSGMAAIAFFRRKRRS